MIKKNNIKIPSNINSWWNFGSLISIYIFIQFIIGFFLSINYFILNLNNKFNNSLFIYLNLNFGWIIRIIHRNLTSLIFILLLIHLYRNIFFYSFINKIIWITGIIIIIIYIIISFLGYTLTWTQISYWGIIVITNFISIIPLFGKKIIFWIWGNFKINIILINRFFSLHFILPIFIFIFIFIHLNIIHNFKSNNPLGLNNKIDFLNLIPNLIFKDFLIIYIYIYIIINLIFLNPFYFYEYDNFNQINYFKTPNHIKPEWYFIFFYSILRSIENKFRGLILIIFSIFLFIIIPFIKKFKIQNFYFNYWLNFKLIFFIIILFFISLLGSKNIEFPYFLLNKIFIYLYFLFFI